MKCLIEFSHFEPDDVAQSLVSAMLRRLLEIVPQDSVCKTTITRLETWNAKVEICSDDASFGAEDSNPILSLAMDRAECEIQRQIEEWKELQAKSIAA